MSDDLEVTVAAPLTHQPRRSFTFEQRPAEAADQPFTVAGQPLGAPAYAAAMVLAFAVLGARRPSGVFHPNLWAEDGPIFLRSAYLEPWYRSLFHSYNGYLHLVLRAWAELASLLPASAVAAAYAVFALAAYPLCLSVVLSRRLRWLIPSDGARAALFVSLLLIPGARETIGNLTNALWPIGIGLMLLSFCDAPRTRGGRIAELAALALGGLTGATSMLLWPAFALRWWRQRERHNLAAFGVVLTTAIVQGLVLVANPRDDLGLQPALRTIPRALLLRIWGLLGVGEHTLTWHVFTRPMPLPMLVLCVLGVGFTVAALLALPWAVRLHAVSVFALSLAATAWAYNFNMKGMAESNAHGRYFLIPTTLVVITVFAAASTAKWRRRTIRLAVLAPVAALFGFAVFVDLGLPALPQTYWAATAKCIDHHQSCTVVVNPRGFSFELPPIK
ncbi:MAG: hypothetical protein QOG90_278 [Actinomycetota bacterium]|jgi:hypothetical protein